MKIQIKGKLFVNSSTGQISLVPNKRDLLKKLKISRIPDNLNKSKIKLNLSSKLFK